MNFNATKTTCKHGHPLSGENLYVWASPNGSKQRVCKTCRAARKRSGRPARDKTVCKHGHPLSGENLYVRPRGSRECRTCRNEGNARLNKNHSERRRVCIKKYRMLNRGRIRLRRKELYWAGGLEQKLARWRAGYWANRERERRRRTIAGCVEDMMTDAMMSPDEWIASQMKKTSAIAGLSEHLTDLAMFDTLRINDGNGTTGDPRAARLESATTRGCGRCRTKFNRSPGARRTRHQGVAGAITPVDRFGSAIC